jgi:hypothetical protein
VRESRGSFFQKRIWILYQHYYAGVLHEVPPPHNLSRPDGGRQASWLTGGEEFSPESLDKCRFANLNKALTVAET